MSYNGPRMDSSQKDASTKGGTEGIEGIEGKESLEGKVRKAGGERSEEQLEALQAQVAKLTDIAGRAQADLQNSKIRMEREAEDLRKYAVVPLLLALLPVRDDLARALNHSLDLTETSKKSSGSGQDSDHNGIRQILDKLDKVFASIGLKRMEALGKPVDPSRHEIINAGPGEKDIVTAIHEEGYELHGRVLRPAKVQVGNGEEL